MSDQAEAAERFRALHVPGRPLVLFNVWDAGSARAVMQGGAKAIGTSSWAVAQANGFGDGEQLRFPLVIDNLRRIITVAEVPVTIDLERGYGSTAERVAESVSAALAAGAVGCNLEDGVAGEVGLRDAAEQAARISSARRAANEAKVPFFINARTDVFFQHPQQQHDERMLSEVLARAGRYADNGADGLFAPGLTDLRLIALLVEKSPLPVNIMMGGGSPSLAQLAEQGVARISYGAQPYLLSMQALERAARGAQLSS